LKFLGISDNSGVPEIGIPRGNLKGSKYVITTTASIRSQAAGGGQTKKAANLNWW